MESEVVDFILQMTSGLPETRRIAYDKLKEFLDRKLDLSFPHRSQQLSIECAHVILTAVSLE